MKISDSKNTHSTNSPGESHDFEIGDTGMIIEILRNRLYRHPIRTLVQEYISNARDAVREANLPDHKLIVKAPTKDNPSFSVRDFGKGITPERMKNVFVKYGSSTKRESNKQTGGFGIGAKSAWAYADSFTIITRIDGIQRQYLAHIGSKNQGVLEFIGESQTTEENGTEITVPVKISDINAFHVAIQRCVFFWADRPTLMGLQEDQWFNVQPDINKDGITLFSDFSCNDYRAFESYRYLVVDGIPYYAKNFSIGDDLEVKNCLAAIHCDTGEVEISASREGLSDTEANRKCIEKLTTKANDKISKIRKEDCEEAKDVKTYIKRLAFWCSVTPNVSGVKPKFNVSLDGNFLLCLNGTPLKGTRWRFEGSKLKTHSERQISFEDLKQIPLFIKLDTPMSPASYLIRVRQSLKNSGKPRLAFGFTDLPDELMDLKISDVKVIRNKPAPKTKNPVQIHNLQRYNGYSFYSHLEDFSNLANNKDNYIYVNLDENRNVINEYYEVAQLTKRHLVGVGAKAKKAIEKAKESYPEKFFTPAEILKDPELFFGKDYQKVAMMAQRNTADRSKNKNLQFCLKFIELTGMDKAIDELEDKTFRENFSKIMTIFKCKDKRYLPEELNKKILSSNEGLARDMDLACLLGELIYNNIPFINQLYVSSIDSNSTLAIVKALNLMIKSEKK